MLNPNIILGGRSVNVAGAAANGLALADAHNTMNRDNKLRSFLEANGGRVMAGDQNALAGLASHGPEGLTAAQNSANSLLGREATRQGMDLAMRQEARLTAQEERLVREQAAQLTAAQRQQEVAQIEEAVRMGLAATSPEQWDALVANSAPDLVGQFENREIIANKFLSVAEIMKGMDGGDTPASFRALELRAQASGLERGTPEYQEFMRSGTGGQTINVNTSNPNEGEFEKTLAKSDAETIIDVEQSGMAALRNIPRIDQMTTLLESTGGGLKPAMLKVAGDIGLNLNGMDEVQAATAIINSLIPEQRAPGSGPMSDADLALFKQSLPRLINQPGGNRLIIDTMRGIAEYDAQGAQIVQSLRNGQIDRTKAFELLKARENPLAQFTAPPPGAEDEVRERWIDMGDGVRIKVSD